MKVRGQSQQKRKLVQVILDASCEILRWKSWKRVWMSKFFSFYLKPDLLRLAMKENLFLNLWSWGWEGVVSCGFFTSWPSASPRWTCLRSGGQESCPETQKAVVQWSGPGLGAAMSKHRPFHQDFFHPRPVPLPCKGQMWEIQSPFSSNDFSNVHNSLWSNWTYSADFPSVPWSYENFDFVWIMSHSWWRQWKKEGTRSEQGGRAFYSAGWEALKEAEFVLQSKQGIETHVSWGVEGISPGMSI